MEKIGKDNKIVREILVKRGLSSPCKMEGGYPAHIFLGTSYCLGAIQPMVRGSSLPKQAQALFSAPASHLCAVAFQVQPSAEKYHTGPCEVAWLSSQHMCCILLSWWHYLLFSISTHSLSLLCGFSAKPLYSSRAFSISCKISCSLARLSSLRRPLLFSKPL